MTVKEQILKAIEMLPEDATFEDAIDRLQLLCEIERGRADVRAGRVMSQDEARKRAALWPL